MLKCSFCGSSRVKVHSSEGAFLRTDCDNCGMTSDTMARKHRQKMEEKRTVEIRQVRRRFSPKPGDSLRP